MDAVLMFEVLLYLNLYFFGLFCVGELVILLAKCLSPVLCIPNIGRDAAVLMVVFASEILKLQGFKRSRERSKCERWNGKYNLKCLLFSRFFKCSRNIDIDVVHKWLVVYFDVPVAGFEDGVHHL